MLGSIRVGRMSDVWRVLELVKEQAWLNETLRSFQWRMDSAPTKDDGKEAEAGKLLSDEEELEALIQGKLYPAFILAIDGELMDTTYQVPMCRRQCRCK